MRTGLLLVLAAFVVLEDDDEESSLEPHAATARAAARPLAGVKKLSPWATIFTGLPATAASKDFLIATSSAEALMSKR